MTYCGWYNDSAGLNMYSTVHCRSSAGWFVVHYLLGAHEQTLDTQVLTRDGVIVPLGYTSLFHTNGATAGRPLILRYVADLCLTEHSRSSHQSSSRMRSTVKH